MKIKTLAPDYGSVEDRRPVLGERTPQPMRGRGPDPTIKNRRDAEYVQRQEDIKRIEREALRPYHNEVLRNRNVDRSLSDGKAIIPPRTTTIRKSTPIEPKKTSSGPSTRYTPGGAKAQNKWGQKQYDKAVKGLNDMVIKEYNLDRSLDLGAEERARVNATREAIGKQMQGYSNVKLQGMSLPQSSGPPTRAPLGSYGGTQRSSVSPRNQPSSGPSRQGQSTGGSSAPSRTSTPSYGGGARDSGRATSAPARASAPRGTERFAKGSLVKSRVNQAGVYTKPGMRKKMFESIKASATQGTRAGQWSARKAQLLAKNYKAAGGGYKTKK